MNRMQRNDDNYNACIPVRKASHAACLKFYDAIPLVYPAASLKHGFPIRTMSTKQAASQLLQVVQRWLQAAITILPLPGKHRHIKVVLHCCLRTAASGCL